MVVDELLDRLSPNGFDILGYADDITITVRGKFKETLPYGVQLL